MTCDTAAVCQELKWLNKRFEIIKEEGCRTEVQGNANLIRVNNALTKNYSKITNTVTFFCYTAYDRIICLILT